MTLYFIISKKMGLEGIYLAQVIGNSFFILVLMGYSVRNSRVYFDGGVLMSMSSYSFPLLMANISAALLTVIDRFSLNSLALLKSVALYTLAFKITSVLKLVIGDSIKLAIGPMMFKWMDKPDNKRFYSKVLLYSSYVMMFAIVGISMFSYEIIKVITNFKTVLGSSCNYSDSVPVGFLREYEGYYGLWTAYCKENEDNRTDNHPYDNIKSGVKYLVYSCVGYHRSCTGDTSFSDCLLACMLLLFAESIFCSV